VVYVIDSSVEVSREDEDFLAAFEKDFAAPLIIALNKSDVTQSVPEGGVAATGTPHASVSVAWRGAGGRLPPSKHEKIFVSAKTGEGIKRLVAAVSKALGVMARTQNDSPALGSARQKKACEEARDSARHALSAHGGFTLDAVAADIEDALYSLSEITGAVTPDDILDTVFSKFCLGK
jgi:tRNA modification GTPase